MIWTAEAAASLALVAGFGVLVAAVALAHRPGRWMARPGAVLGGVALLSASALAALVDLQPPALSLTLDPSTEPLLPRDDPERALYEQSVREFGDDEIFAIAMQTPDLFQSEHLEALRRVHDEVARLPGVRRVRSLADVVTFRYDPERDWVDVGRLFDQVPRSEDALGRLRERALGDPLLLHTAVSPDGGTAGLSLSFRSMTDREFIESRLDDRIAEILRDSRRPDVAFAVAGRPHAKAQVYRGMVHDLRVLIPLGLLAVAAVLTLAGGSRRGTLLPLATVMIAELWTFALLAALGRPLTLLSTVLGPVLIAVGSVYGVHVMASYTEIQRDSDPAESGATLAFRTLAHVRLPVTIAAASTQIGFAALLLSDVPAVKEMGAFAVLGVACVTLLSLTALPAALALLPRRDGSSLPGPLRALHHRFDRGMTAVLDATAGLSLARPWTAIGATIALAALSAALIPRIVIDTDYLSYFDPDSAVRRDFERVNQLLAGAIPLYVVVSGAGPGSMREPEALRAVEVLQARVAALPGTSHTASLVDTLRALNRAIERDDPTQEKLPDSRAGVTELLQLTPKDEVSRLVNANHSRVNLVVRTGEVGSQSIRELAQGIRDAVDGALPPGVSAAPTGNALLLARSADGIARSQPQTVALAAIAIFGLIALALRSLPLGLVAMVPNLLPVLVFFGMLGAGAAPLSLPTSMIGSMALGIAIDDTAHFLVRYGRERRAGADPERAAWATVVAVGRPIAVTSLMLAAGFSVIALSGFAPLREFGVLSALTMLVCVMTDLLILPALLARGRA